MGRAARLGRDVSGRSESAGFRWWMPLVVVAGLAAVGVGVMVVLFLTREDPGARPVEEAVEDFRSSTDDAADVGPTPGVYELEGEGSEAISFPATEQTDGSIMPMTITVSGESCWNIRIDYNEAHWQQWDLCADGRTVTESGGSTFQRWDFGSVAIENLSTFVCDPEMPFVVLDAEPGDVAERSCTGTNDQLSGTTTSSGTVEVLGVEAIEIGGESIEAMNVRHRNDLTGSQHGTDSLELWVSTEDGLPLRGTRSLNVESDSPIGAVTYTEEGFWELLSTTPRS